MGLNFIKRILWYMVTDPNSSEGLIYTAEKVEEHAADTMYPEEQEKFMLYAKVLRELASKNWPPYKNKQFIKENVRR